VGASAGTGGNIDLAVSGGCLGVDGCGTMLDLALTPPASVNSARPGEIVLWNEDGPLPGFVGVIVLLKGVGAAPATKGNWCGGRGRCAVLGNVKRGK
jgi:hypothetical protein